MAKKISYKEKTADELKEELAKLRESIREAHAEKMKTGNAQKYRMARKNIARILTVMNSSTNA